MAVITLVTGRRRPCATASACAPRGGRARWVAWLGVGDALQRPALLRRLQAHDRRRGPHALPRADLRRARRAARPARADDRARRGGHRGVVRRASPSCSRRRGARGARPRSWTSAALGAGSAVFYASNVIVNKFVVDARSPRARRCSGTASSPPRSSPRSSRATRGRAVDPRAAVFLARGHASGPARSRGSPSSGGCAACRRRTPRRSRCSSRWSSIVLGAAVLGEHLGAQRGRRRRAHPRRRAGRDDVGTPLA